MGIFDFFKKSLSKEMSSLSYDNLQKELDKAIIKHYTNNNLPINEINRSQSNHQKIRQLYELIDELSQIKLEYSNLSLSSEILYLKSSINVISNKYNKLQIFETYDDTILKPIEELIDSYLAFLQDLKNHVISTEKRMLESIIDTTLRKD